MQDKFNRKFTTDFFLLLILLIVLIVVGVVRIKLIRLPLDRDEGEYAYAGWRMLHGDLPFRDFYNMKMPGIYGVYSLVFLLMGSTATAVRLAALLVNICNTLFVFLLAKKMERAKGGTIFLCLFPFIFIAG